MYQYILSRNNEIDFLNGIFYLLEVRLCQTKQANKFAFPVKVSLPVHRELCWHRTQAEHGSDVD